MCRDCRMKLAGVSKKVMDLLNVTRLAMAFDIVGSEDDAVAAFQ
jgi:hypothetical protein